MQFGQIIARVLQRLVGGVSPRKISGVAGGDASANSADPLASLGGKICTLCKRFEFCLSRSDHEGGGLTSALELIRNFTGLTWVFLTVLKGHDKKHYYLAATSNNVPKTIPTKYLLSSGLAGWVHTKLKPLTIDRFKTNSQKSFIFQKNEPLNSFRSFYGWPVLYNDQPRGALILAGVDGETLNPIFTEALECIVDRLAARLHMDRLILKVMELDQVDSQTSLPHRGQFLESLHHMMEVADIKGEGVDLYVLATSGLGEFATRQGQEAAGSLLKSIAAQLKEDLRSTWRLGHISYGVFTLAAPTADAAEAKAFIIRFKKNLENWPLIGTSGRAELGLFPAMATYPCDGLSPEQLLEIALTALADDDNDDG
ncbi:MAG: hypothetical protein AMR96_03155 [Candidatus Adiutrix intracellularis]|nr:MAG: hypothetical protein AMR96_03155 [Candidatus Adiutrix intracellularis]